jgi:hypothetical protein
MWDKREWYEPVTLEPYHPDSDNKLTKAPKFATIDIETQDWVNYVCGEVYWIAKNGQEMSFETNDIKALMIKCFEIKAKYKIRNFVAHFGGKFDFLFFIKALLYDLRIEIKNIIPRGPSILSFKAILHNPKRFGIESNKPVDITFRDSSALLPFALGSLTRSFNVETLKGEMDFLFVKQVYDGVDYLDDIIEHPSCVTFLSGKQISKITKDIRRREKWIRYWNFERYPLFPFLGKISYVRPYMLKLDKKGNVVKNDWFEEVTYPVFKRDDLLKYLHNDCKSLYQCIDAFFKAPLISSAKRKWTTASQAVEVFRLFLKTPLHSIPDSDDFWYEGNVDEFVRKAYFGGRTEIFKPVFDSEILGKDWLYYYDVNSLYPFVMKNHEYGDKFIGWIKGQKEYDEYDMAVWHCKVRVPENMYVPVLGTKVDDRLVFPVGEFSGYWTKYELEYAKTFGCEILELYEGAAFENVGYIFKDFINTLYQMRLDAKEKNDNVTQMVMKLIMNSCYGRMGINKNQSTIFIDDLTGKNARFIADIELDNGQYIRLSEKEEISRTMFSNPFIACMVTSYARIHLHKQIMSVGGEHVYYCDTDSVFSDVPMKTGKELGAMKLEYKCKSACFILPKTYVNDTIVMDDGHTKKQKLTMKGFDYKNIRNAFTIDEFVEYLNGEVGMISVTEKPKFATFKTALRMGEFVTMKNDPDIKRQVDKRKESEHFKKTGKKKKYVKKEYKLSEKTLQGRYNKRIIIQNGFDTEPLLIRE